MRHIRLSAIYSYWDSCFRATAPSGFLKLLIPNGIKMVVGTGFEPVPDACQVVANQEGYESEQSAWTDVGTDPALTHINTAWEGLSGTLKAAILLIVESAQKTGETTLTPASGEPPRAEQESAPKGSLATARKEAAGLALGPAKKRNRSTGEGAR